MLKDGESMLKEELFKKVIECKNTLVSIENKMSKTEDQETKEKLENEWTEVFGMEQSYITAIENIYKQEKYESMMKKIDASIKEMKKAEKEYEGNHEWLRFGVKFWEDGKVTYHANYKGCKDKDGIMADSTDELLKKLMNN